MKKMFIGGQWVAAQDGRTLPVIDPADGQPFDEIPRGTVADVDRAVQAARAASGAWGNTTATERGRILCKIAEAVLAHEDELARLRQLRQDREQEDRRQIGEVQKWWLRRENQ